MDRWSSPMRVENRLWAYLCAALPGSFWLGVGLRARSGFWFWVSVGDLVSGWFAVGWEGDSDCGVVRLVDVGAMPVGFGFVEATGVGVGEFGVVAEGGLAELRLGT
jgi:hypothetical protein